MFFNISRSIPVSVHYFSSQMVGIKLVSKKEANNDIIINKVSILVIHRVLSLFSAVKRNSGSNFAYSVIIFSSRSFKRSMSKYKKWSCEASDPPFLNSISSLGKYVSNTRNH